MRVTVRKGDESEVLEADQVLMAIGRRPLSADLGLEVGRRRDRREGLRDRRRALRDQRRDGARDR